MSYIFNWIIFAIIIFTLVCKCYKKHDKDPRKQLISETKKHLLVAITLSVLFGLGWGVGLLATEGLNTVPAIRDLFSAIFIILTAFQGLMIFILQALRSTEVRKEWKKCFSKVTGKTFSDLSTSFGGSKRFRSRGGQPYSSTNQFSSAAATSSTSGGPPTRKRSDYPSSDYGSSVAVFSPEPLSPVFKTAEEKKEAEAFLELQEVSTFNPSQSSSTQPKVEQEVALLEEKPSAAPVTSNGDEETTTTSFVAADKEEKLERPSTFN